MKGRAIRFFFVLILCVGACSVLYHYLPDHGNERLVSVSATASFKDADQRCLSSHSIISAEKRNNNHDYTHPISEWEIEETDDENETSDVYNQPAGTSGRYSENAFFDFLRQSGKVTSVPLFILFHSWKSFL